MLMKLEMSSDLSFFCINNYYLFVASLGQVFIKMITSNRLIILVNTKKQTMQKMEQSIQKPENDKSGMQRMIQIMGKELNTSDPLELCKKILTYMVEFTKTLQDKRGSKPDGGQKRIKLQNLKQDIKTKDDDIIYPSRKTRWVRNITLQQQKIKYQQQKFIAFSFIQLGVNYHFITQHYPKMLPKTYRCYVEAINNQTVNQITDFLRYQCRLQVERLNRDQKRSIRTQLTKIRQWLGNRQPEQLDIFYNFIRRHYDKSIVISEKDALRLYKTILCIIRSPYINVLEAQQGKDGDPTLTMEEEKAMIISYIKWKQLTKVADLMCQKYGYDMKWSLHSVRSKLRDLLAASISKLTSSCKKGDNELYKHFFTPKNTQVLLEHADIQLKIQIYSFYLERKTTYPKVKNLLTKIKEFFELKGPEYSQLSLPKIENTKQQESKKEEHISQFDVTETKFPQVTKNEEQVKIEEGNFTEGEDDDEKDEE